MKYQPAARNLAFSVLCLLTGLLVVSCVMPMYMPSTGRPRVFEPVDPGSRQPKFSFVEDELIGVHISGYVGNFFVTVYVKSRASGEWDLINKQPVHLEADADYELSAKSCWGAQTRLGTPYFGEFRTELIDEYGTVLERRNTTVTPKGVLLDSCMRVPFLQGICIGTPMESITNRYPQFRSDIRGGPLYDSKFSRPHGLLSVSLFMDDNNAVKSYYISNGDKTPSAEMIDETIADMRRQYGDPVVYRGLKSEERRFDSYEWRGQDHWIQLTRDIERDGVKVSAFLISLSIKWSGNR